MEYNLPLNCPINLDALDDYLMSDHAPDDSMGLSDLDGFLTGRNRGAGVDFAERVAAGDLGWWRARI